MKWRVTEGMDALKRDVCCSEDALGKEELRGEGKAESVPAVILLFHRISVDRMRSDRSFICRGRNTHYTLCV